MKNLDFNITPIAEWSPNPGLPLLIAGPCSAESQEQVLQTARLIEQDKRAMVFRAGIWKPRTRPGTFEGVGYKGLAWLAEVKKQTRLLTATEVARAEHVKLAIDAGVDILWLGARTTVNPFSVQEIADALQGHDIPVLVKNPINPDLQLWVGALERIHRAGISKLAAIHRGFSPVSGSIYRNDPIWRLPIELKRLLPELPIICDPSHIGGKPTLIEPIGQKAFDLQMDGLMIETHINPEVALSDARQQVTPDHLSRILDNIVWRKPQAQNRAFAEQLETLRGRIDELDSQLIDVLAARMKLVDEIAELKKQNDVTILQVSRYQEMLENRLSQARSRQVSEAFIKLIFEQIHQNSIRRQEEIMNAAPVKG